MSLCHKGFFLFPIRSDVQGNASVFQRKTGCAKVKPDRTTNEFSIRTKEFALWLTKH